MLQSSSENLPEPQYALAPFHRLLQKHPFAFWGGLWTILLIVVTVATIDLLNPGPVEEKESNSTPAPTQIEESPEAKSPEEKDWSLPLFSTIVLGCAGGSLLITSALRRSTQRRRFSKRAKSSAIVHQSRSLSRKRRRSPVPRKPQPAASVRTQPHKKHNIQQNTQPHQKHNIQQNTQPNIPSTTQQTQVTVLAPEDNHPLDSQPESLAEMMDLRKRQSLKSLMRGKSD